MILYSFQEKAGRATGLTQLKKTGVVKKTLVRIMQQQVGGIVTFVLGLLLGWQFAHRSPMNGGPRLAPKLAAGHGVVPQRDKVGLRLLISR